MKTAARSQTRGLWVGARPGPGDGGILLRSASIPWRRKKKKEKGREEGMRETESEGGVRRRDGMRAGMKRKEGKVETKERNGNNGRRGDEVDPGSNCLVI